jgi:hypothetical protein
MLPYRPDNLMQTETPSLFQWNLQTPQAPVLGPMTTPFNFNMSSMTPAQVQSQQTTTTTDRVPDLDQLITKFSQMNIDRGTFSEVFHFMYASSPNTIINYKPVSIQRVLQGTTKFNSKYEQDFFKQVTMYNQLSYGKFTIEYKKEASQSTYYDCVYHLQFSSKKST